MTQFSTDEKRGLYRAIYERRDVRSHFLPTPVPDDLLGRILDAAIYEGEKRNLYDHLKLAAITDAPLNLCVTCDRQRTRGAGLGRQSNPETDLYSTVCAVQNLWLAARAESLGIGWVSILDTESLKATLKIPRPSHRLERTNSERLSVHRSCSSAKHSSGRRSK